MSAAGFPELGRILRLWRYDFAGMTQQKVALGLNYGSRATVNMWETGERGIKFWMVKKLDELFCAGGALADMTLAMGSPHGLPGHRRWALNRQDEAGPNWAWLRPNPGYDPTPAPPVDPTAHRMSARVEWCGLALEIDELCSRDGVFVQFPSSDPGLTIRVTLGEPGWVNFGRAVMPRSLGIPVHDFLTAAQPIGGPQRLAGLVSPTVARRYLNDPAFAHRLREHFEKHPDLLEAAVRAGHGGATNGCAPGTRHHPQPNPRLIDPLDSDPVAQPLTGPPMSRPFTDPDYTRLRDARCYSQAEAAGYAEDLRLPRRTGAATPTGSSSKGNGAGERVTKGKVGRVERGGRPRVPHIRALLDKVYAADGYTCSERVEPLSPRSPFEVRFPRWWVGPVWFTFSPHDKASLDRLARRTGRGDTLPGVVPPGGRQVDEPVEVVVQWEGTRTRFAVEPGETITCRRHSPDAGDFSIECPGWYLTAGMGFQPAARELDLDRWAVNDQAVYYRTGVHPLLLHLFDLREDDLTWICDRIGN